MPCQKVSINTTIRKPRITTWLFRGRGARDTGFRAKDLWSPGVSQGRVSQALKSSQSDNMSSGSWVQLLTTHSSFTCESCSAQLCFSTHPQPKEQTGLIYCCLKTDAGPQFISIKRKKYPVSSNEKPCRILPVQMRDGDLTIKKTFHLSY